MLQGSADNGLQRHSDSQVSGVVINGEDLTWRPLT